MSSIKSYFLVFALCVLSLIGGIVLGLTVMPPMIGDLVGPTAQEKEAEVKANDDKMSKAIDSLIKDIVVNRMVQVESMSRDETKVVATVVDQVQRCEITIELGPNTVTEKGYACVKLDPVESKFVELKERAEEVVRASIDAIMEATGFEEVETQETAGKAVEEEDSLLGSDSTQIGVEIEGTEVPADGQ